VTRIFIASGILFGAIACGNTSVSKDSASAGASAGGASVGGASVGGASVGGASVGGASAGGASVGGASAGGATAGMAGALSAGNGGQLTSAGAAGSAGNEALAGAANGGSSGSGGGAVVFADVQAIFTDRCVTCHDKSKTGLPSYPQLSLVEADSLAALVNQPALETCGGKYVVPGQPSQSYLLHKVADAQPCEGGRMPLGFEVVHPVPLTAEQISTISNWISAGAH